MDDRVTECFKNLPLQLNARSDWLSNRFSWGYVQTVKHTTITYHWIFLTHFQLI